MNFSRYIHSQVDFKKVAPPATVRSTCQRGSCCGHVLGEQTLVALHGR